MKRYTLVTIDYPSNLLCEVADAAALMELLGRCSTVEVDGYGEDRVIKPSGKSIGFEIIPESMVAIDLQVDPATKKLLDRKQKEASDNNSERYKEQREKVKAEKKAEQLRADILSLVEAPQNAATMRKRISELCETTGDEKTT